MREYAQISKVFRAMAGGRSAGLRYLLPPRPGGKAPVREQERLQITVRGSYKDARIARVADRGEKEMSAVR